MGYKKKSLAALAVGALGVVFGDIGTSPLYALHAVFGPVGQRLAIDRTNVYGIISLVIWSVMLVVSIKFVGFIMRADNKGEGGIMALVSLVKSGGLDKRRKYLFIFLGLIGVALFYGDSAITPAISVLSAVEGLKVVTPNLDSLILPVTFVILSGLFWIQKYGTNFIGRLFGPVMLVWFAVIALGGGGQIWQHPGILMALSPLQAITFFIDQPLMAFISMGAVVLAITGAEALYADLGHFGRPPIARAWFWVVFPALTLCYMGQGALLLHDPAAMANPFILLFPPAVRFSVVLLATLATLIASQSVISGAFSLTRQAVQLDFLPKMLVRHTSDHEIGQVYMPFVNLALFIAVSLLVFAFGSSVKLASAYGVAVSGTLAIDTILFIVVVRDLWQKSKRYVVLLGIAFVPVDLLFVSSNLSKIKHGGWFPLALAAVILLLIDTWRRGQKVIKQERKIMEGSLQAFVDRIRNMEPPLKRIPGEAVYISHHPDQAPLALHATVDELHELSEKVVLVTVKITDSAHVPETERAVFDSLRYKDDGISHLTLYYGFHDSPNIPRTLAALRHTSSELNFDPDEAAYFISLSRVVKTKRGNLANWRKSLYSLMSRNALSTTDYYKLPIERTMEMHSLIKL
ncbi:MAG TPA: KUP/HAK/KT family potassium transporter [Candidatus Dormibacteraeota bacterium]|nr:KUP/HAK/KT family potassium transporter [Candidatus Dormibacteraeota bacterium]